MKKQILEYILRIIAFIVLTGALHEKISTPIMYGMEHIFTVLYERFPFLESSKDAQILLSIILGLFSLFTACIGVTYVFAKICGIFKKLDDLKKWQAFLILLLINIILWIIDEILDKHRSISYSIRGSITITTLIIIPTYLFHLYLNYLTKKLPEIFEKIKDCIEILNQNKNKLKNRFLYILRVTAFIVLTGTFNDKISTPVMHGIEHVFFNQSLLLFSYIIVYICITYLFAKICGIFKKLDNLKKWQAFLIVVVICSICNTIYVFFNEYEILTVNNRADILFAGDFLIPSYLLYLCLNYLTKKFPEIFEKIGYCASLEFFKNMLIRIKTKLHSNFLKKP